MDIKEAVMEIADAIEDYGLACAVWGSSNDNCVYAMIDADSEVLREKSEICGTEVQWYRRRGSETLDSYISSVRTFLPNCPTERRG